MKRVLKFIKQNIIGFILGIMITGIGVVTAATLVPATGVSYSNSSSNVTNVNEALDELFTKVGEENSGIVYLGNGTSFDVSGYSGYENFTVDNFIVESSSGSMSIGFSQYYGTNVWGNTNFTLSKSYNASTGVFTVSTKIGTSLGWNQQGDGNTSYSNSAVISHKVYLNQAVN